jgi:hypothetical protein
MTDDRRLDVRALIVYQRQSTFIISLCDSVPDQPNRSGRYPPGGGWLTSKSGRVSRAGFEPQSPPRESESTPNCPVAQRIRQAPGPAGPLHRPPGPVIMWRWSLSGGVHVETATVTQPGDAAILFTGEAKLPAHPLISSAARGVNAFSAAGPGARESSRQVIGVKAGRDRTSDHHQARQDVDHIQPGEGGIRGLYLDRRGIDRSPHFEGVHHFAMVSWTLVSCGRPLSLASGTRVSASGKEWVAFPIGWPCAVASISRPIGKGEIRRRFRGCLRRASRRCACTRPRPTSWPRREYRRGRHARTCWA